VCGGLLFRPLNRAQLFVIKNDCVLSNIQSTTTLHAKLSFTRLHKEQAEKKNNQTRDVNQCSLSFRFSTTLIRYSLAEKLFIIICKLPINHNEPSHITPSPGVALARTNKKATA
jgi:hypothetical protein